MHHEILYQVIFDRRRIIQRMKIVSRAAFLEPHASCLIDGMRRCGKSALLRKHAEDIVAEGCGGDQVVSASSEDERLLASALTISMTLSRRLRSLPIKSPASSTRCRASLDGDASHAAWLTRSGQACIAGSNAEMLGSEMEKMLGGRCMASEFFPYSFAEHLDARHIQHDEEARHASELMGSIQLAALDYLRCSGLPESAGFIDRRSYADAVYQKVLLGDICARHSVRSIFLMKKPAEAVTGGISCNALRVRCWLSFQHRCGKQPYRPCG